MCCFVLAYSPWFVMLDAPLFAYFYTFSRSYTDDVLRTPAFLAHQRRVLRSSGDFLHFAFRNSIIFSWQSCCYVRSLLSIPFGEKSGLQRIRLPSLHGRHSQVCLQRFLSVEDGGSFDLMNRKSEQSRCRPYRMSILEPSVGRKTLKSECAFIAKL